MAVTSIYIGGLYGARKLCASALPRIATHPIEATNIERVPEDPGLSQADSACIIE
jgi:hypothetical protein